jgi:nitrite reductase (NADH) large subunit
MFGQNHGGDVGHEGKNRAASMPDDAEVCGCNGVCKGTIVKAIKEKGLFTLDEVRKHTKASSSCGSCTGLVEQILASAVGGAYQPVAAVEEAAVRLHRLHARVVRKAIRDNHLLTIPEAMRFLEWKTPNGCPSCRPALNYYLISPGRTRRRTIRSRASSTSARTPTSRRTAPTRWCRACGAA